MFRIFVCNSLFNYVSLKDPPLEKNPGPLYLGRSSYFYMFPLSHEGKKKRSSLCQWGSPSHRFSWSSKTPLGSHPHVALPQENPQVHEPPLQHESIQKKIPATIFWWTKASSTIPYFWKPWASQQVKPNFILPSLCAILEFFFNWEGKERFLDV